MQSWWSLAFLGGFFNVICFICNPVHLNKLNNDYIHTTYYVLFNQIYFIPFAVHRLFHTRHTESSYLRIYHGPFLPPSWFAVTISILVSGTLILVINSSFEVTRLGNHMFQSYVCVLLAYIGKRLPIVDSPTNALHLAVAVVSFAGFLLFSIYKYSIWICLNLYKMSSLAVKVNFSPVWFRAMLGASLAVRLLSQPISSMEDLLRWNNV